MIVPMKKIHLIVQKKDESVALESLRDFGSLHVEHQAPLGGERLVELKEEVKRLENVISFLRQKKENGSQESCPDWQKECCHILEWLDDIEDLKENIFKRQVAISQWEAWGNFEPQDIKALEDKGVYVQLCEIPITDKSEPPQDIVFETIFTIGGLRRCIAISKGHVELEYKTISPADESLEKMHVLQEQDQKQIKEIEQRITDNAKYLQALEGALVERQGCLHFEEVKRGMRSEEELTVLKAFCPEDQVSQLEATAKKEQWAVTIEEPADDDMPPTLLRNKKWVDLSKPILKIIDILPGFKEFDVSMVFLLFFILFFAILIGDTAYGLIFMGATFFVQKKFKAKIKDNTPFNLMYILTLCTCLWGVLTGTYFGQQWLPPAIKPLVPWLNEISNIQLLCFVIALVHLSIARIWSAVAKFPSITFLSEVGWMLIIWGMFFVAKMFVLGLAFPAFAGYFFMVGIPLAFFFMVEPKDFLKTVGMELVPFFLSVISAGTDLVSYIRLFAVGLATVAVADATNGMASSAPIYAAPIILVMGHGLNLILALMAILVHAIRLNVLEFSGQLGLEWTGVKYNPFTKFKNS